MGHRVSLFVGPSTTLRAIVSVAPRARVFALTPAARFLVLPLTEEVHDDIHAQFGTGDWPEQGPLLSSTDLGLAQRASRGAALAYVETDYFGGQGRQNALLWRDGALILQPSELTTEAAAARSAPLRPINAVLRALGVVAVAGQDEFDTLGLGRWRSNDDIVAGAQAVSLA